MHLIRNSPKVHNVKSAKVYLMSLKRKILPAGAAVVYSCCNEEFEDMTTGTGTACIPEIVDTDIVAFVTFVVPFVVGCC